MPSLPPILQPIPASQRVLLPWRSYDFPIDWSQEFDYTNEPPKNLHLEIGFGDGRFTLRRAQEHLQDDFVGLEIASASLQRGWKKIRRNGLSNVRLLKVGAQFAVRYLFAPASLNSIVVNFPDPWPKERHEKHRLLQASFFDLAATRLKAGGSLNLATDHPEYLAFAQEQAKKSGFFDLLEASPPEAVFETKYALKWKTMGKPLFYQVFSKKENPEQAYPEFPSLERLKTMPHALIKGDLPATVVFDKQVLRYADGHVILHEAMLSMGSDDEALDIDLPSGKNLLTKTETSKNPERWLFRATIDEPDFKQQLLVVVKRRTKDELIVRLEPFGDPVITKTTRGAVHAVTEWLLSLPAGLEIKERNY